MLAIADLAAGDWPDHARFAAITLSDAATRQDESDSARLLADIYEVFTGNGEQRLRTVDLIDELSRIEESPWGDWQERGKPISAHALSKLLKPFQIKTMSVYADGKTVRGYKLEQFGDAWLRVLGVRSVRSVRSGSGIENDLTAANAPNALEDEAVRSNPRTDAASNALTPSNAQGTSAKPDGIETKATPSADDGFTLLGDPSYPDAINGLWPNHVTSTELHQLHRLHALVVRSHEAT